MNDDTRHRRRINWGNYSQAGPVRITNTQTGETRIERALHPAEVKRIVAEGHFLNVPKKAKQSRSKRLTRAASHKRVLAEPRSNRPGELDVRR